MKIQNSKNVLNVIYFPHLFKCGNNLDVFSFFFIHFLHGPAAGTIGMFLNVFHECPNNNVNKYTTL